MPKLGNALDFAQLEALNIRIHQATTAPTSPAPVKGQMYFNSVANELFYWDGSIWQSAKSGAGSSGPPSGPAGGNLAGTYPNPTIGLLQVDDTHVKAANKDGASATPSLRTLGTGAAQAAAGNDSRFTDARAPNGTAGGDLSGTYPNPGIAAGVIVDNDVNGAAAIAESKLNLATDAAAGTGSRRTVGTGALQAMAGNTRLDTIAAPTGAVSANSQKITNLATPAAATDAATMGYVDSVAQGLDAKQSVKAATAAGVGITLSGTQTVDGVALVVGDRCLVKDNALANNGIYVVAAGAWTRATDADTWAELVSAYTWVEQGGQADTGWVCTADQSGTLGSSAVIWNQFSGAGSITAGAGLTKTGNSLDVGAGAGITVAADTVLIGTGQVTDAMLATAKSGYYSTATHGAGATITVPQATHGLRASRGLIVQVRDEASGAWEIPDHTVAANGDVTITYAASVSANSKRVTVIG